MFLSILMFLSLSNLFAQSVDVDHVSAYLNAGSEISEQDAPSFVLVEADGSKSTFSSQNVTAKHYSGPFNAKIGFVRKFATSDGGGCQIYLSPKNKLGQAVCKGLFKKDGSKAILGRLRLTMTQVTENVVVFTGTDMTGKAKTLYMSLKDAAAEGMESTTDFANSIRDDYLETQSGR